MKNREWRLSGRTNCHNARRFAKDARKTTLSNTDPDATTPGSLCVTAGVNQEASRGLGASAGGRFVAERFVRTHIASSSCLNSFSEALNQVSASSRQWRLLVQRTCTCHPGKLPEVAPLKKTDSPTDGGRE
ncbi:MAG: hypothetical protein CMJ81_13770 [Planctomycetaceae bacterium]|nr:hypothetical protein [Planctomycetaceae bacterium]